jgi:hypothetical protein
MPRDRAGACLVRVRRTDAASSSECLQAAGSAQKDHFHLADLGHLPPCGACAGARVWMEACESGLSTTSFGSAGYVLRRGDGELFGDGLGGLSLYHRADRLAAASAHHPGLGALSKEGEAGRQKLNTLTHIFTVPLALLQGFGQASLLAQPSASVGAVLRTFGFRAGTWLPTLATLFTLAAGTMFAIWLGN